MLHSSALAAPVAPTSANSEKGYVSRSEFKMIFDDEKKSLTIESPGGRKFMINDDEGVILIQDGDGNKVKMESSGITIEAASTLTLKGGSQVKIEAPSVSINGSGTTEIKGGIVQIN
jgi:phage baseplate assembly protein gpV